MSRRTIEVKVEEEKSNDGARIEILIVNFKTIKDSFLQFSEGYWKGNLVAIATMFAELLVLVSCYIFYSVGNEPNAGKIWDAAKRGDMVRLKQYVEEFSDIPAYIMMNVAYIAIEKNNLEVLKYVAEKYPSVVTKEEDPQYLVLRRAVEHGLLDMVKYLVERQNANIFHRYDVSHDNYTGYSSVIHIAVELGHLDLFKYFVEERNASVDTPIEDQSRPPLFIALFSRHDDIVRYLIEERNADLTVLDCKGEHILYTAAFYDNLNFMKYLLEDKGAKIDINRRNKDGESLLMKVVGRWNGLDIAEYLVGERGADVNIADLEGRTPLHCVESKEMCTYLTDNGANVNQKSCKGETPLHAISHSYHEFGHDIMRCLVEHGADVNAKNDDGRSALLQTSLRCDINACKYLIEHGADVNLGDNEGDTPLNIIIDKDLLEGSRNHELFLYFLEHGADVHHQNKNGDDALHVAVSFRLLQVCKDLVGHGANINQKNHEGETPVFVTVKSNWPDGLHYLVGEAHADVNIPRTGDNMTPLHEAASRNYYEICRYLIQAGAHIRAEDKLGMTPAQKASNKRLITLLQNKDPVDVGPILQNAPAALHSS